MPELIDVMGGDVRFEVAGLEIDPEQGRIDYVDASGSHELACDYIVGCDGDRGVSRPSIPVDVLAEGLLRAVLDHDTTALNSYSATVLPRLWRYQEFSVWMTETLHDAGDPTRHGTFRQMTARARLDALFDSPTAARLHGDYQRGLI